MQAVRQHVLHILFIMVVYQIIMVYNYYKKHVMRFAKWMLVKIIYDQE